VFAGLPRNARFCARLVALRGFVVSPKVQRLVRYTGVNVASTVVDYTIFLTFTHLFGAPILQSVIAYSVAILVNYALTKNYVFLGDMSHKSEQRLFVEFVGTGMLGLILTATVIWFAIHVMASTPIVAKTISMLICFVTLYFVRSRLVFNESGKATAAA
jgi:putative flippase GtrA